MCDEKKIDALLQRAVDAGLDGLDFLASFSRQELAEGYNGIGPEFLPEVIRAQVTSFLWIFEPAALIHDMRNEVANGTREGFLAANDEFRYNCLRLADDAYPTNRKHRVAAKAAAEILYLFVSADGFGWKAWLEAHERYVKKTNQPTN